MLWRFLRPPGERDADARGREYLRLPDRHRCAQCRMEPLGHACSVTRLAHFFEEQRELVATEARQSVHGAEAGAEPARRLDEQLVAGEVAERVVHDLEMIEVDEEHRERIARITARALGGVAQPFDETRTVRQSGEPVVEGIVPKLPLDPFRYDSSSLEFDLGHCGRGYLGEVLDLLVGPGTRHPIESNDERQRLAGGAGDADTEETSNT